MRQASPFEGVPHEPRQSFSLEEINGIQIELMQKSGGDPHDWILQNAEAFRNLINSEFGLHEQYLNDHDGCMQYIKEQLEKKTLH
jgi:hypothetical protein